MNNSNPPNVLFFKTETMGHPLGYSYVTIAKDQIKIQAGDFLEYDIFIDITAPLSQAGLEMHFVSGRCMRESMIIDPKGNTIGSFVPREEAIKVLGISMDDLNDFRLKFPVWKDWDRFSL